ncbi:AAA family ATPase [Flavihumibacter fluvii]|uniref:AAA family ATPase n=1 Tax=Flavihumibacter fluvii TaxID=2838157 RepID=UPI001BDE7C31|nr:AAA family ATPase [Flavihumibacter fluvii]ULQ51988.1 AAA family ATPase [Flavihumibacter fluvii]
MELIERDDFLALLQDRFRKVAAGEGHCFFIFGEPGIGKTALVKAFLSQVEQESIQYTGACDSLFTPRPLAPLYDLALQNKEAWAQKIHSSLPRAELFTTVMQELSSKSKPVILVFEDIHWADEATLDFVKFLSRRISRMKCLFILTCRDDEVSRQHSIRNVLGDLAPDTYTRTTLTPLSRQAVQKLAGEKGYDPENVYTISGGNPFYVNEILASYSPGVPDNIKDSILAVYDRQEEGTKNAWQICSVIPEGLEINRFAKIKSSWDTAMDHCFALKIIIIKNDRVIFKHELYRRTIENSLSPFKRISLNKMILDLFLGSFEENGEIERIVHYAKNANENNLVVKYAPIAARQAASVGSHIEASKLFLTAIEYSEGNNEDQLVSFYEDYAYECYLTNQGKDAIIYQGKALKTWQKKNEIEQAGNSMRMLSRLWWFEGNRAEAEKNGHQAIDILAAQPASKAKAMAFSNISQLKMHSEETAECVAWGTKAIEMAREIHDDETLCHSLNNMGCAQWKANPGKEEGKERLFESLEIALRNSFHEHAARAYSNIITSSLVNKEYALANEFLEKGIDYCEERNLDSSKNYQRYLKARLLLETGDWSQAGSIVNNLLAEPRQFGIVKIGALIIRTVIETRKGATNSLPQLQEVKTLAFRTGEYQQIVPVAIAILEYEWLTAKRSLTDTELKICIDLVQKVDHVYLNSEFGSWLKRARQEDVRLPQLAEPYMLLEAGKVRLAAIFWEKKGCPFEKAFALCAGNEDDKREALVLFQQLGADAIYEKVKMEMRATGIKKIPRGLRESTKTNPAQLTNRELDIIQLLQKAIQNKDIAEKLFISPKTVDHHISSIFFKLDVNSRAKAVAEAVRLGILK